MGASSPIIEVHSLSKLYRLGELRRRRIVSRLARPIRRYLGRQSRAPRPDARDLWALRDMTFDVSQGEVVGLVGSNGAGKSTLLKILSRVTEPTEGHAIVRGRVQSLLEVGTGFHNELTGRENIFLKGAIHGMSRQDVQQSFDAIVAFADVERFLDTPFKRWSSGMRVRLGFAVAALLPHDILVVDEVLAVGDARFRRKALDHVRQLAQHDGTTVLFVSHDLDQIRAVCPRVIQLDAGRIVADGETEEVLAGYLQPDVAAHDQVVDLTGDLTHSTKPFIRRIELVVEGGSTASLPTGAPLTALIDVENTTALPDVDVYVEIESLSGARVLRTRASHLGVAASQTGDGSQRFRCTLASLPLVPGTYWVNAGLTRSYQAGDRRAKALVEVDRKLRLTITDADVFGAGEPFTERDGLVWTPAAWRAE